MLFVLFCTMSISLFKKIKYFCCTCINFFCWLHGKGVRNYDSAEVYDLIRSRGGAQMGKIILL